MASEFHKRAISRITPEERKLMVKSLEIISQIHSILDELDISQKDLAEKLEISPAAVSKMLSPGGNLELKTINKLEYVLGVTIITTPKKIHAAIYTAGDWGLPKPYKPTDTYDELLFKPAGKLVYANVPVN